MEEEDDNVKAKGILSYVDVAFEIIDYELYWETRKEVNYSSNKLKGKKDRNLKKLEQWAGLSKFNDFLLKKMGQKQIGGASLSSLQLGMEGPAKEN